MYFDTLKEVFMIHSVSDLEKSGLNLVDFDKVTPESLQTAVLADLQAANDFLDGLQADSAKPSASEALARIEAFEAVGASLDRDWGIVSHLNAVMSGEAIRACHHALLPKISAYGTRVGQSVALFDLYQAVKSDEAFFLALPIERQRAVDLALRQFRLSGVALSAQDKAKFAQIQSRLSVLSARFADNILDATGAYFLPLSQDHLAGIPDSGRALLAQAGKAHSVDYGATLDIPVYLTVMTYADDRSLRERLYQAYVTRASELDQHQNAQGESLDNAQIMQEILALRAQKAALLGFQDYAQLSLASKMADTSEQVEQFLYDLAEKATPYAQQDLAALEAVAGEFGIDSIQAWDLAYLAEKVKQKNFSLSQEEIRPYFPLPKVIEGLFAIVNRLYGVQFKQIEDQNFAPVWHPDVQYYQVYHANGDLLGAFYFDLYARQGKRGGAWMSGFQPRHMDKNHQQLPVCFMVANFSPLTDGKPSLLTHDEITTLFHEFGHGLHHLLTQVNLAEVSGVNGVEWDAVELPSQFMENWAWQSEAIGLISAHLDTGDPLPEDKLNALLAAKNFQNGLQTLRQLEFALFDLKIHQQAELDYQGILKALDQVRQEIALIIPPAYNRFANSFSHIFAGGYASGYYSYKWAERLSADAFAKFEEDGIFNPETGQAFWQNILATGGSRPAKTNFKNFRGRDANTDALLRHSGFTN